jgi:hypothetical protein
MDGAKTGESVGLNVQSPSLAFHLKQHVGYRKRWVRASVFC